MAKQRGPDGTPVDVPSDKPSNTASTPSRPRGAGGDDPTDPPPRRGSLFPEEGPTLQPGTPAGRKEGAEAPSPSPRRKGDDGVTVLQGGRRRRPATEPQADSSDELIDPVAGWLVVVDGPGIGRVLTVGHGQNSIGRGTDQRITVDFGDEEISRTNHASIIYDPRGRIFLVQQGSGKNLVYVDEALVLSPTPIQSHSEILLGRTRLRFLAFCGPEFSWQDR